MIHQKNAMGLSLCWARFCHLQRNSEPNYPRFHPPTRSMIGQSPKGSESKRVIWIPGCWIEGALCYKMVRMDRASRSKSHAAKTTQMALAVSQISLRLKRGVQTDPQIVCLFFVCLTTPKWSQQVWATPIVSIEEPTGWELDFIQQTVFVCDSIEASCLHECSSCEHSHNWLFAMAPHVIIFGYDDYPFWTKPIFSSSPDVQPKCLTMQFLFLMAESSLLMATS